MRHTYARIAVKIFLLLVSIQSVLGETVETNRAVYTIRELGPIGGIFEVTKDQKYIVTSLQQRRFVCSATDNVESILGSHEVLGASGDPVWRLHNSELYIVNETGWNVFSLPDLKIVRTVDKRLLTTDPQRKANTTDYPTIKQPTGIVRLADGWTDGIYVWDVAATRITAIVAEPALIDGPSEYTCEWRTLKHRLNDVFDTLESLNNLTGSDRPFLLHEQWPFSMEYDQLGKGLRLRFFDQIQLKQPLQSAVFFRSSGTDFTFVGNGIGYLVTIDRIKDASTIDPFAFANVQPDFVLPTKIDWKYRFVNSDREFVSFNTIPPLTQTGGIDFTALSNHPMAALSRTITSPDWNQFQSRASTYVRQVTPEYERVVGSKPNGFPFPFLVVAQQKTLRFEHVVWADIAFESLVAEFSRQTQPESIGPWQQRQLELRSQKTKPAPLPADTSKQLEQSQAKFRAETEDSQAAQKLIAASEGTYQMFIFGLAALGVVGLICASFFPKLRLSIILVVSLTLPLHSVSAQGVRVLEGNEFGEMQNLPIPGIQSVLTDPSSSMACVLMEKKQGTMEIGIVNLKTGKAVKKFVKPQQWNWSSTKISNNFAISFDGQTAHVFQLDSGKLIKSFRAASATSVNFLRPNLLATRDGVLQLPSFEPTKVEIERFYFSSLSPANSYATTPISRADGRIEFNGFELGLSEDGTLLGAPADISSGLITPAKVKLWMKADEDANKKKKSTQIAVSASRGREFLAMRAEIASELVDLKQEARQFSDGWTRAHSNGLIILRWKPLAISRVGAVRALLERIPVLAQPETEFEFNVRLDSDQNVVRVGNNSQAPSPQFSAKFAIQVEQREVARMLLRECVAQLPNSVEQLVESYRSANRTWIEIVERKNQQRLAGVPILLHAGLQIELEHGGGEAIKLPCVLQYDDLDGLKSHFGDLFKDQPPAVKGMSELVRSSNFQFVPIELKDENQKENSNTAQPVAPVFAAPKSTVHVERAQQQAIARLIGLFAIVPFGLIGIPIALRFGLHLTVPVDVKDERNVSWWRLLTISGCFICIKPLVDWVIALSVGAFLPAGTFWSLLFTLPLSLAIAYGLLFGISCVVCKAHYGRFANAILVAMAILVVAEVPKIMRAFMSGFGQ